jgi:hypothetical protein
MTSFVVSSRRSQRLVLSFYRTRFRPEHHKLIRIGIWHWFEHGIHDAENRCGCTDPSASVNNPVKVKPGVFNKARALNFRFCLRMSHMCSYLLSKELFPIVEFSGEQTQLRESYRSE